MRGFFITFEGIEGSGKSTVARRIDRLLRDEGVDPLLTREPGGTVISEDIRGILLDPDRVEISAKTELLLYLASRAQLVAEVILPAVNNGRIVLCDRYMDATMAYQGWARGLGEDLVRDFNSFAVGPALPDLTFLFDLSVSEGFRRGPDKRESSGIQSRDRLESEDIFFHEKVREGYLRIAETEKKRVMTIDASLPLDSVVETIFRNIKSRIDVQSYRG
ncbi:MAG: dTMP kinase [Candidatus Krumholzibacteriota bacterium]|nr:dTMP kinase [Candidatus Krumholzibacteriota bacterium]